MEAIFMLKKENYTSPEMNIDNYAQVDVLTASDGLENANTNEHVNQP